MKVKKKQTDSNGAMVDFLFEVGMLAKTPRSYTPFLGHGNQSVAEHTNRAVYIGYVLSTMLPNVDQHKIMKMCLFHDLAEARTSDLNYVHQKYTVANEGKAIEEISRSVPFGDDIENMVNEFNDRKSMEARLAKDADRLEYIISLKEHIDTGSERAKSWMPSALKRLDTKEAITLAKKIVVTKSDNWWFANKEDAWWIHRNKK